jgi:hypothetical protein
MMLKYHDRILLEVSGHDHVADLRYFEGSHPYIGEGA